MARTSTDHVTGPYFRRFYDNNTQYLKKYVKLISSKLRNSNKLIHVFIKKSNNKKQDYITMTNMVKTVIENYSFKLL